MNSKGFSILSRGGALRSIAFAFGFGFAVSLSAQPYAVLHRFPTDSSEGIGPVSPLVEGNDGNFYGVAGSGGADGVGTAFRITPAGVFTKIHDFTGGPDGAIPSGLVWGGAGDDSLYGFTSFAVVGMTNYPATFFKMDFAGNVTTLHYFVSAEASSPESLVRGTDGLFYGVSPEGGAFGFYGSAFRLDSGGGFEKLRDFGPDDDPNGTKPHGIGEGADHNFYGFVNFGCANHIGGMFTLGTGSDYALLHSFVSPESAGGSGLGVPLIGPADGDIYGTSLLGASAYDVGGVWRMTPSGSFSYLHAFQPGEGFHSYASIIQASDGNLYGATNEIALGAGAVYQVTPSGSYTTVHTFHDDADGSAPYSAPIQASDGSLYGVTSGTNGFQYGVVYRLSLPPSVSSITPASGPAAGGVGVTLEGTSFVNGALVAVGGVAATGIGYIDATTLQATTPALTAGTLNDVQVTNPDTSIGVGQRLFFVDFLDVPAGDLFHDYVEKLIRNGITAGCGGGDYCRNNPVTRQQMAVFLLKAEHGSTYVPPHCVGIFPDVTCTPGVGFPDWIEQLAGEGITSGCGSGNYCPTNPITRQQMAAFLLKTEHGSAYAPPGCTGLFGDVTCPSLFADWIEQLYAENVTGGCQLSPPLYCPGNSVLRGQMAAFLVKTFQLP
jgi:uncharacterized repeat protein (TIGR03803 family)